MKNYTKINPRAFSLRVECGFRNRSNREFRADPLLVLAASLAGVKAAPPVAWRAVADRVPFHRQRDARPDVDHCMVYPQPDPEAAAAAVLSAFQAAKSAGRPSFDCYKAGVEVWKCLHPDQAEPYAAKRAVGIVLAAVEAGMMRTDHVATRRPGTAPPRLPDGV
jgi:hypothetical protein